MKDKFLTIYAFLLAAMPILSGYAGIASVDLGTLVLFVFGLMCIVIIRETKITLPKGYPIFLIVAFISALLFAEMVPLGMILFALNIVMALNYCRIQYLLKTYDFLVYCSCAFFVVQEIIFGIYGIRPSGMIPGLPLVYQEISESYKYFLTVTDRSSSFFLEPAYFVEFLFPFIVIKLYHNSKKSIIEAFVVSAIILSVKSGTGVALLLMIWGVWFFFGSYKKTVKISVAIALVVAVSVYMTYSSDINYLLNRTQELNLERGMSGVNSSGFVRFYRGYLLYAELPLINQLFGASMELVENVMGSNYYFSDNKNLTFFNGAQSLLIFYGFFSFILFMRHLILYCFKVRIEARVLALCCIFLMLSEAFFLTPRLFLCTVLICLFSRHYKTIISET